MQFNLIIKVVVGFKNKGRPCKDRKPDAISYRIKAGIASVLKTRYCKIQQKAVAFYLRCICSVSEPLAAQQSNAPAIAIDNKIITIIKTTTFNQKLYFTKKLFRTIFSHFCVAHSSST